METPEDIIEQDDASELEQPHQELHKSKHLSGMYQNWFLDYASYVILERAVPNLFDGLKPVQRRLLHAMKDLDDGRYNKVANIIGHTMKYHPHGDASIGDALVQMGQKDLLIDAQGNWGNIFTGDSAAAPRYIEARLSKFALEVAFNSKITVWKLSYDGRNKEPVNLPVKFPLLLHQGSEGIAVGLASKILPHNFNELIDASINILQNKDFEIFPDFLTGGLADVSKYNDGLRGGRIRVRARITKIDKKTLCISDIPFGCNTTSLIDSILTANDKGKIKVKKIDDNTAGAVEILIHLPPDVNADTTIDALYAFTDCELSLSPNCCVIDKEHPRFIGVSEILRLSTANTLDLIRQELEIQKLELEEQWHFASLEKIFIEKRIYRKIEECETWEAVIDTIDKGLKPYVKIFKRPITNDDIVRLTEIKIKRISKFDAFKADEHIANIETNLDEVINHLANLIDYTINYFKQLKKKYGKDYERKTEIRNFDNIQATMVAVANQKLYVNRTEGFAGSGLKKDEYVCDCSDLDDIIVFRGDGTYMITKVVEKVFVGQDILHIEVFRKNDETVYNAIYIDGFKGSAMVKRFGVQGVTRDKIYDLTKGKKNSKVIFFSVCPNSETEIIQVKLKPKPKLKKVKFGFDFASISIKGRNSLGNILTKHEIKEVIVLERNIGKTKPIEFFYDDVVKRINLEERGYSIGKYFPDDKIIAFMQSGTYTIHTTDLNSHFEEDMIWIGKYNAEKIFTIVYFDGESAKYFVKRFKAEKTDKKVLVISEYEKSSLSCFSSDMLTRIEILSLDKKGNKVKEELSLAEFIEVRSIKAKGNKLPQKDIKKISLLEPFPYEEEDISEEIIDESNDTDDNTQIVLDETEEVKEEKISEPIKFLEKETKAEDPKNDNNSKDGIAPRQMTLDF